MATYFRGVKADPNKGRIIGSQVGQAAWALAREYYDGSITNRPIVLAIRPVAADKYELRFNTVRGFSYALESATSLDQPFAPEPSGFIQAHDVSLVRTSNVWPRQVL